MRRTVVALSILTALSLTSAAASSPARTARVTGLIRLCGGPAPGRCFTQDGIVSVLNSQHKVIASEHTKHAAFAFELAPGTYTLQATTGGTRGQKTVTARAHTTTKANVVIGIP